VDSERKELAKAKSEAELQNLKNQINPHFLLNTLNNIYALIEFDPPRAQQALMDLSKMLRHLLYENNQAYVPLRQEAAFMRNYIALMRIRLADNVKLTTRISHSEQENTLISPLIFISLIENAFKHGISGEKPSFIDISLRELPGGKVEFVSRNSYFPKSESDKSGSGIGLELVKKRLELLYPGNYQWKTSIEKDIYSTILLIDTKKQQNDT
jgi:LytS/YehU family sensor histidine kinase